MIFFQIKKHAMQLLQQVLFPLPGVLVELIESFVGLRCLGGWRAVSHQAYNDVEAKAKTVLLQLHFVRPLLEDLRNLNTSAYWFQVMKCTYNCKVCKEHTFYTQAQVVAQVNKMCNVCFNELQERLVCDVCFMHPGYLIYNTCLNCYMVACDECCDETLNMCLGCTELFCQSCITDDYCNFCVE